MRCGFCGVTGAEVCWLFCGRGWLLADEAKSVLVCMKAGTVAESDWEAEQA